MKLCKLPRWCDAAEMGLSKTLGADMPEIAAGVNAGRLELWAIDDGESWMVTRVEAGELIVCCYQGSGLRRIADVMYRIAQNNKLAAVRFFTERPAIARALRPAFPVKLCGYVYRCEVSPKNVAR